MVLKKNQIEKILESYANIEFVKKFKNIFLTLN